MEIYLAPLEGITNNIFRTNLHRVFGGVDKFFMPFVTPSRNGALSTKAHRDILPENNLGQHLVPQILTNSAEGFLTMCQKFTEFGYNEFNLNLGCPSGTVVSKGRGSGFLAYPDKLDAFLDEIFKSNYKISIKTRIGRYSPDEFFKLLEIFNKYPLHELIIHPRTREDMYNNTPDMDIYAYACKNTKHRLCYNGDIKTPDDVKKIESEFPETAAVMIGRGAVACPALPFIIKNGGDAEKEKLKEFYENVFREYELILYGSVNLLHKMKELMFYISSSFEGAEKEAKRIKKAKNINEFKNAVNMLFENQELKKL